jgi:exopolysaccharide production protein ExoZ
MSGEPVNNRIDAIQVLRALAALLVVVTHAINAYDFRPDLPQPVMGKIGYFNTFGAIGVDIFFVVSGFVMAHTVANRPQLSGLEFLKLRLVRVLPPYWLATIATVPLALLWFGPLDLQRVISGFTVFPAGAASQFVLPILHVGWSLAFELGFYGVVGAVMLVVARPERRVIAALLAASVFAALGIVYQPSSGVAAVFLNAIWFEFVFGMLVYLAWSKLSGDPALAALCLAVGLAALAKLAFLGSGFSDDPWTLFSPEEPGLTLERNGLLRALRWGLPSAVFVLGLLWFTRGKPGQWLTQTRPWKGLHKLGDASYSLYLVHPFVMTSWQYCAPRTAIQPDLMIAALVGFSIALSLTVHARVELPLLARSRTAVLRRGSAQRNLVTA